MEQSGKFKMMVLLFTDIEGSVEYKSVHGDVAYSRCLKRHNGIFKGIVETIPEARVMNNLGDGFLASFATVSDALQAGLRFQYAMAREPWQPVPIKARTGVHSGQVIIESEVDESTGAPRLVGRAVDMAARVMGLAMGGQILMTRAAYDDAHQFLVEHPPVPDGAAPKLKLIAHGKYIFKGAEADPPMEVYEIGGVGIGPMQRPMGGKGHWVEDVDTKAPGWRPLTGQAVPHRPGWVLQKMLGRGGFGEAWLAAEQTTGDRRVFKFCFDVNRLKSLRQESELLNLLKGSLGQRDDIARLVGVRVDEKLSEPYFLELEYAEGGNLADWAETVGGIENVAMATRIDLVRQVAEATEAAHSVGIIHKDIKPSNVLIYFDADGTPRARLCDFGIGRLTDPKYAQQMTLMKTQEAAAQVEDQVSTSGTAVYCPPEFYQAGEFTEQGDVYALGVLLFQVVVGDLKRPTAEGWKRDIRDPMIRHDIADCVDGDMARRIRTAGELATRLRDLSKRKTRRRVQRVAVLVSVALMLLTVVLSASVLEFKQQIASAHEMQERLAKEKKQAEDDLVRKKQQVIEGQVLTGDLAVGEGRWDQAKALYQMAIKSMDSSQSRARAELGLRDCYQHSPPALASYAHDTAVKDVSLSGDGRYVASIASDGHLILWDAATRQAKMEARLPAALQAERLTHVALSRDGLSLATGSSNGAVRFWDIKNKLPMNLENSAAGAPIIGLAFTADGTLIAAANDGIVRRWRNGVEAAAPPALGCKIDAMAVGGSRVCLLDPAGNMTVREIERIDTTLAVQRMRSAITSMAVSDDGASAIFGCESGNLWYWKMSSASDGSINPRGVIELSSYADRHAHDSTITSVAISADGKRAVSGSSDQTVKIWDLETGTELRSHTHLLGAVQCVAFSADGNVVASAGSDDHTINLWDGSNEGGEMRTLVRNGPIVQCLAVAPDGRAGVYSQSGHAGIVDLVTGQKLREIDTGGQTIISLAISPGGDFLLAGMSSGEAGVWNIATAAQLWKQNAVSGGGVLAVAFSPDGELAATAGADNQVVVWNVATHEEVSRLAGHSGAVRSLAFATPSLLLSGSDDRSLRLWDVNSKTQLDSHDDFTDSVRAIAVSGNRIVTGGEDRLLRLWQLKDGKLTGVGDGIGHRAPIHSVAFVGDSRIVVSADTDQRIKFWDLDNQLRFDPKKIDELGIQQSMSEQGASIAVAGDQSVVLTADKDGSIRVWQFHRVAEYKSFEEKLARNDLSAADLADWYRFRGLSAWTPQHPTVANSGDAGNVPQ